MSSRPRRRHRACDGTVQCNGFYPVDANRQRLILRDRRRSHVGLRRNRYGQAQARRPVGAGAVRARGLLRLGSPREPGQRRRFERERPHIGKKCTLVAAGAAYFSLPPCG
jgi:hypothetical protein